MHKTDELNIKSDLTLCKEFNDYLKQTILEPNKLSEDEIKDLCKEFLYWLPCDYISKRKSPEIKIGISESNTMYPNLFCTLHDIWEKLFGIIDNYTQTRNNIRPYKFDDDFSPVNDLGLVLPFDANTTSRISGCGALNKRFYKLIYYFDFLEIPIRSLRLKDFWKFYKKTMNVYTIEYKEGHSWGKFHVIPKPDEIFIEDKITHCMYDGNCYCNGVKVPKWLYDANKEDLKISDFNKLTNADTRTLFIEKAGIEKFIEKGEIIDSYENYPENEWWAKSEYKLIDMKKILIKEIEKTFSGRNRRIKYYDYAPFLMMKNQTTGVYHLEGVSPDCKDLYDAIKMRYKGLNLPKYDIENIK